MHRPRKLNKNPSPVHPKTRPLFIYYNGSGMNLNLTTYNPIATPVHALDARCKIVLMVVFSIAVFAVESWKGIGALSLLLAVAVLAARLNLARALRQLVPVLFIVAVTLAANSFTLGFVPDGILSSFEPIPLVGDFVFWPAGFERGCFFALRIVLLVGASLVLTTTTTANQTTRALEGFLSPLARFGLPARDIATVVSIALRFIPLTIDQFQRVRAAQTSRGACFDTGSFLRRLRAWRTVLIPWFVALYRKADGLASALDARCYGATAPTHLNSQVLSTASISMLAAGLILCIGIAWAF